MVKKFFGTLAAVVLLSGNASADIIDVVEQEAFVGWWGSHSYVHDINDDGFELGSATGGDLAVSIWDDWDFCLFGCVGEVILFVVEDFDFDTGGISFGTGFFGDLEVEALGALNADGLLNVTVKSLAGDFYVGDSVLTVYTRVPEPGTLALLGLGLGLGLAGLGVAKRRRAQ